MKIVSNIKIGKAKVRMDKPTHVPGIREGNSTGHLKRAKGFKDVQKQSAKGTAARSTGIRSKHHGPIDPRMPYLSPS